VHYSALISCFFPFSVLLVPLCVLYSYKQHARLNSYLTQFNFLIVEVFIVPAFIVGAVLLIPFAYLKIVVLKLKLISKKLTNKTRRERLSQFFFFLLLGYVQLAANTIADVINLVDHLFTPASELQRRSVQQARFKMNKRNLDGFVNFTNERVRTKETQISKTKDTVKMIFNMEAI